MAMFLVFRSLHQKRLPADHGSVLANGDAAKIFVSPFSDHFFSARDRWIYASHIVGDRGGSEEPPL